MTGIELDVLCEEWLEAKFPNYRKFYHPYYWILSQDYPLVFQRVMRRFEIDWEQSLGIVEVGLVDLDTARIALGLTRTPVPDCFEQAFTEGELAL